MNHRLGRKRRTFAEIRANGERCTYCESLGPFEVDHMPPKAMFPKGRRPRGMEFPACEECNRGTSGADAAASFIARLDPEDDGETIVKEFNLRKHSLLLKAPGLLEELFGATETQEFLVRSRRGILLPKLAIQANGPIVHTYLNVFAAKFGMALFRQHTGKPLPPEGRVYSTWFLNAGLARKQEEHILSMFPAGVLLAQGRQNSWNEFKYRFNTDRRTIVGALAAFHRGLYVLTFATTMQGLDHLGTMEETTATFRLGELSKRMPHKFKLVHEGSSGAEERAGATSG